MSSSGASPYAPGAAAMMLSPPPTLPPDARRGSLPSPFFEPATAGAGAGAGAPPCFAAAAAAAAAAVEPPAAGDDFTLARAALLRRQHQQQQQQRMIQHQHQHQQHHALRQKQYHYQQQHQQQLNMEGMRRLGGGIEGIEGTTHIDAHRAHHRFVLDSCRLGLDLAAAAANNQQGLARQQAQMQQQLGLCAVPAPPSSMLMHQHDRQQQLLNAGVRQQPHNGDDDLLHLRQRRACLVEKNAALSRHLADAERSVAAHAAMELEDAQTQLHHPPFPKASETQEEQPPPFSEKKMENASSAEFALDNKTPPVEPKQHRVDDDEPQRHDETSIAVENGKKKSDIIEHVAQESVRKEDDDAEEAESQEKEEKPCRPSCDDPSKLLKLLEIATAIGDIQEENDSSNMMPHKMMNDGPIGDVDEGATTSAGSGGAGPLKKRLFDGPPPSLPPFSSAPGAKAAGGGSSSMLKESLSRLLPPGGGGGAASAVQVVKKTATKKQTTAAAKTKTKTVKTTTAKKADQPVQPALRAISKRRARTFAQKLMDVLLNHLTPEDESEIASWLPDGRSFAVVNPTQFVTKIIPRVFAKSCKYESLTRKMNRWGFVRMTSGSGVDVFSHEYFRRDEVELVLKMTCKDVSPAPPATVAQAQGGTSPPPLPAAGAAPAPPLGAAPQQPSPTAAAVAVAAAAEEHVGGFILQPHNPAATAAAAGDNVPLHAHAPGAMPMPMPSLVGVDKFNPLVYASSRGEKRPLIPPPLPFGDADNHGEHGIIVMNKRAKVEQSNVIFMYQEQQDRY